MNQYPSRLSRNDLYSYGFKEGQPWGDDRRSLESALRAMDQLEREIQQNYIYNKAVPTNPWTPYPTPTSFSRSYKETMPRAHYHSQAFPRPPADIRIDRSNASDTSQSESSSSSSEMTEWSDRQNDYGYPGYTNGPSGRPQRQYQFAPQENIPAIFHRPSMAQSPQASQGRSGPSSDIYAPPLSASNSRYSQFQGSKSSFSEKPSFYHPTSAPTSPHSPTHPSQPFEGNSQSQLVIYQGEPGGHEGHQGSSHHYSGTASPLPRPPSPGWSMATTRGNGSENLSMGSSGSEVYSDDYHHPIALSGYAEPYNAHPHSSYLDYRDTVEDPDQDYMSDGVASDEGVYYSSSEEREYDDDDGAVFSDGGYSDDDDDYSYDDSD